MMAEKMTEEKLESYLKNAIEESTPDMLDELMAEIEQETATAETDDVLATAAIRQITATKRARGRRKRYRVLASCAAAVMLFVGAFTLFNKSQNDVFAVVNLDVNPSVELSVSKNQEVIEAVALNEDGRDILDGMDLAGTDVKVACNALIGSMMRQGYLSEMSNSVLVSVRSEDAVGGKEIEHMISSDLNDCIRSTEITGAVVGQYVGDDQELESFASEHGISPGKAWLIKNLLATGSKHMTEESLLSLSTQELILLGQERHVETDDSYGSADTSKYISEDEAKAIALQDAGRTDMQTDAVHAEFDCDDGTITYEVEFTVNGQEYEYDINAETGEIIEAESEIDEDDDDDIDDIDDDDDDDGDGYDDDDDEDDDDDDDDDDDEDDDD